MTAQPLDLDAARKAVDTLPGRSHAEFLLLIQALLERAETGGIEGAALLGEIARRRGLVIVTEDGPLSAPYTISKGI
jgi:hypothetical protein